MHVESPHSYTPSSAETRYQGLTFDYETYQFAHFVMSKAAWQATTAGQPIQGFLRAALETAVKQGEVPVSISHDVRFILETWFGSL